MSEIVTQSKVEILKRAKTFIARGHCKGAFARDINGSVVDARNPWANSWCTAGSLIAATDTSDRELDNLYNFVERCSVTGLTEYNDHPNTTQADILALFDRAIAQLENKHE